MSPAKVLFVLSSHDKLLNGKPTGWYLPEAAHPYAVVKDAGFEVVFASPAGGAAPLDPSSVEAFKDDKSSIDFKDNEVTKKLVENTVKLSDVKESDFAAIFYVGGHGPCFDLAVDPVSIALAEKFFAAGKPTAAVCHGPVVFHKVKDPSGNSIFKGRKVTCFSDDEEKQAGLVDAIPFLVESDIRKQGGDFQLTREAWGVEVVVDKTGGILITGANPASATKTGEALVQAIKDQQ